MGKTFIVSNPSVVTMLREFESGSTSFGILPSTGPRFMNMETAIRGIHKLWGQRGNFYPEGEAEALRGQYIARICSSITDQTSGPGRSWTTFYANPANVGCVIRPMIDIATMYAAAADTFHLIQSKVMTEAATSLADRMIMGALEATPLSASAVLHGVAHNAAPFMPITRDSIQTAALNLLSHPRLLWNFHANSVNMLTTAGFTPDALEISANVMTQGGKSLTRIISSLLASEFLSMHSHIIMVLEGLLAHRDFYADGYALLFAYSAFLNSTISEDIYRSKYPLRQITMPAQLPQKNRSVATESASFFLAPVIASSAASLSWLRHKVTSSMELIKLIAYIPNDVDKQIEERLAVVDEAINTLLPSPAKSFLTDYISMWKSITGHEKLIWQDVAELFEVTYGPHGGVPAPPIPLTQYPLTIERAHELPIGMQNPLGTVNYQVIVDPALSLRLSQYLFDLTDDAALSARRLMEVPSIISTLDQPFSINDLGLPADILTPEPITHDGSILNPTYASATQMQLPLTYFRPFAPIPAQNNIVQFRNLISHMPQWRLRPDVRRTVRKLSFLTNLYTQDFVQRQDGYIFPNGITYPLSGPGYDYLSISMVPFMYVNGVWASGIPTSEFISYMNSNNPHRTSSYSYLSYLALRLRLTAESADWDLATASVTPPRPDSAGTIKLKAMADLISSTGCIVMVPGVTATHVGDVSVLGDVSVNLEDLHIEGDLDMGTGMQILMPTIPFVYGQPFTHFIMEHIINQNAINNGLINGTVHDLDEALNAGVLTGSGNVRPGWRTYFFQWTKVPLTENLTVIPMIAGNSGIINIPLSRSLMASAIAMARIQNAAWFATPADILNFFRTRFYRILVDHDTWRHAGIGANGRPTTSWMDNPGYAKILVRLPGWTIREKHVDLGLAVHTIMNIDTYMRRIIVTGAKNSFDIYPRLAISAECDYARVDQEGYDEAVSYSINDMLVRDASYTPITPESLLGKTVGTPDGVRGGIDTSDSSKAPETIPQFGVGSIGTATSVSINQARSTIDSRAPNSNPLSIRNDNHNDPNTPEPTIHSGDSTRDQFLGDPKDETPDPIDPKSDPDTSNTSKKKRK